MTTEKQHWAPHPISELFPSMSQQELADLKRDMVERVQQRLDPLVHPIMLLDNQILDGRFRHRAWVELASEGACDGYFQLHIPPSERFDTDKQGTPEEWMAVRSMNLVKRHISAEEMADIFRRLKENYPDLPL